MTPPSPRYCPVCGAGLVPADVNGRERQRCSSCEFVAYLNPAFAAAGLVVEQGERVLLMRRKIQPFQGDWALPAGYQEIDESPQDTVRRETFEETGIEVVVHRLIELVWIPDDPRKPANVAIFLCHPTGGTLTPGDDADQAAWFHRDELPTNLGFGNAAILKKYFEENHS